jgi:hypothetical protein
MMMRFRWTIFRREAFDSGEEQERVRRCWSVYNDDLTHDEG